MTIMAPPWATSGRAASPGPMSGSLTAAMSGSSTRPACTSPARTIRLPRMDRPATTAPDRLAGYPDQLPAMWVLRHDGQVTLSTERVLDFATGPSPEQRGDDPLHATLVQRISVVRVRRNLMRARNTAEGPTASRVSWCRGRMVVALLTGVARERGPEAFRRRHPAEHGSHGEVSRKVLALGGRLRGGAEQPSASED